MDSSQTQTYRWRYDDCCHHNSRHKHRRASVFRAVIDVRYIPSSTIGVQPCPDRVPIQCRGILVTPHHVVPSYSRVVRSNILPSRGVIIFVVLVYEVLSITLSGDAIDFAWDLARFCRNHTIKSTQLWPFKAELFDWCLQKQFSGEGLGTGKALKVWNSPSLQRVRLTYPSLTKPFVTLVNFHGNSWFSLTWWDDHVGVQNNGKMSLEFGIRVESNS